ncbi:hypothetical protein GUITHDRAFT_155261 [Guillardia theta CCMP2712]|uniref:Glutamine amidotransferase type-2 domain-containing protein n=1 Tax=Guillardia theta (strain CCMP2712) TaxID=905079 RepID=L1IJF0_GUITC|nr:hypothetical protein GUITHDRAFT_155261 [Guillardia theta CCMP2712]EKX36351.1 hypothetical protein GUITHDRAFT_155261 [Guillardia theta CCMP2712]|eukprot:XP_005823331.1 hypothetical protein GUITHDRAFT_155261 [Guillardia theta CCMP2712]
MFLGHTRFATSSAPRLNESHPHRFSGPQTVRVWRVGGQGWEATDENYEVYVTHNGDFDYWELFDSLRTQKDLGRWLQNVLNMHKTIASCDSVKVAGMMELLRTQGIWKHSIRLAYQTSVQPSFQHTLNGEMLLEESLLNQITAIAENIFQQHVTGVPASSVLQDSRQVKDLIAVLAKAWYDIGGELRNRCGTCELLAQHSICYFLENDIFTALDKFLSCAHGSFGITACCTLDPNVVAIASRGQAMSVSFNEDLGVVLWGSEASAQMVPIGLVSGGGRGGGGRDIESQGGQSNMVPKCTHRHDLDEDGGEVIEIAICTNTQDRMAQEAAWCASGRMQVQFGESSPNFGRFSPFSMQNNLFLRVHRQKEQGFMPKEKFIAPETLLSLVGVGGDGPSLSRDASQAKDKVAADLADIPPILSFLRKEFSEQNGKNRTTSRHFFKMIRQKVLDKEQCKGDDAKRLMIDVLVTGAEASLWLGEQFASDLQSLFPTLRVIPMSSNKIIGVLSNTRGEAPMSGFAFCSTTMSLKETIVVSISHSGQTFPTLHATHALRKVCGDRVFVLTGSVDSKMSAAVGQHAYIGAPWTGRVWTTYAGWRPSEALTVSTVAAHHVLTELLLYLAEHVVCDEDVQFIKAAGNRFRKEDVKDLYRLNRDCCVKAIPNILGCDLNGGKMPSATHEKLVRKGRFWALHVLEGPYSWCLSAMYIFGTVVSGYPIFTGIMRGVTHDTGPEWLKYLLLAFDSLLYSFLPLFFSMILRLLQGREQFARLGKRTLVIGDVPYVHQLLESYVSKLFSLSYSIASIDVHGANAVDHLVHRFTHRVARGVLLAVGRPDGRLFSQTKAESWVMMAMQQAKAIVHLLSPPEIITVGHNPFRNTMLGDGNITLETLRPHFLCESLAGVDENEPMSRMATIKELNKNMLSAQTSYADHFDNKSFAQGENLEPIGSSYLQEMAPNDINRLRSKFQSLTEWAAAEADIGVHKTSDASAPVFYSNDNSKHDRSRHDKSRHSDLSSRRNDAESLSSHGRVAHVGANLVHSDQHHGGVLDKTIGRIFKRGQGGDESSHNLAEAAGPTVFDRALDKASGQLLDLLGKTNLVEIMYENRFASLERYVAFLVFFHAMAKRVASFPLLPFDISRSQSQLRIATTAAPISAAEVEREWATDKSASLLDVQITSSDMSRHGASAKPVDYW